MGGAVETCGVLRSGKKAPKLVSDVVESARTHRQLFANVCGSHSRSRSRRQLATATRLQEQEE